MLHIALIKSVIHKKITNVELLLQRKDIDVNIPDESGCTALMYACICRYSEIIKLLLKKRGIDVNIKTHDGYTASDLANSEGKKLIQDFIKTNDRSKKLIQDFIKLKVNNLEKPIR